jgi:hypothetical protein
VEILKFANETKMNLIFGLNGCRGRHGPDSPLDFSNIRALLSKTVASGLGDFLHGVELGKLLLCQLLLPGRGGVRLRSAHSGIFCV